MSALGRKPLALSHSARERYGWLSQSRTLLLDAYWPPFNPSLEFDARRAVEAATKLGCNSIRFGVAGKYALIPNETFPELPQLGGRDLLAELLREAKPNKIKVVAYVPVGHGLPQSLLRDLRPQWALRTEDGKIPAKVRHFGGELVSPICPVGPYREDILRFIKQILSQYEVDGLYLDGPYYDWNMHAALDVCHCDACRESFHHSTGKELPDSPSLGASPDMNLLASFRDWVAEHLLNLLSEINRLAKDPNDLPLLINAYASANRPAAYEDKMMREVDGFLLESGLGGLRGAAVAQGLKKIVWRYTQDHNPYPRKSSRRQEADNARTAIESFIWGAAPIISYGGRFTFGCADDTPLSQALTFIRDHGPTLSAASRSRDIALICTTRIGEQGELANNGFQGLYVLLESSQHQTQALSIQSISDPRELMKWNCLLFPHWCELEDHVQDAVEHYVQEGGKVILCAGLAGKRPGKSDAFWTSLTGLSPAPSNPQRDRQCDQHQSWEGSWDLYLDATELLEGVAPRDVRCLLPHQQFNDLTPAPEVEILASFFLGSQEKPFGPAITSRQVGKGTVLSFNLPLGEAYLRHPELEHEQLIGKLMTRHLGLPREQSWQLERSDHVRTVAYQSGHQRWLLLWDALPGRLETIVGSIRFTKNQPGKALAVSSLKTGDEFSLTCDQSGRCTLENHRIDVFDVLTWTQSEE